MIKATLHFLDGKILEKEFESGWKCEDHGPRKLQIFLDHTKWIDMGEGEFRPMSQVQKVTWKELATPAQTE
jgi:hypothetical protein